MLSKVIFRVLVIAIAVISVRSSRCPKYCNECEEEAWEEVPCDAIPSSTPPPTPPPSTPPPATSSTPAYYNDTSPDTPPTIPPAYEAGSNTPAPESSAPFKKCYCECKSGCKQFCRKIVVYPGASKQIYQMIKTRQPVPGGHIESNHLHQRNFVPGSPPYSPNNDKPDSYQHSQQPMAPPPQKPAPPTQAYSAAYALPPNYQFNAVENLPGYGIDDITKLLQTDNKYLTGFPQNPVPNYLPKPPEETYAGNPSNHMSTDVHVAGSGNGAASALTLTPDGYRFSSVRRYPQQPPVSYPPESPSEQPIDPAVQPYAVKYSEYPQNNVPHPGPNFDNYIRDFLFSHSFKARGNEYLASI